MDELTLYSNLKEEDYIEDVEDSTLPEYLLGKAKEAEMSGGVDWLINSATGERRRFSDLESHTRKIGSAFYKLGLRKGDTVIYMTHDMFYIHALFIGVWRANGIMRASYPEDDEETLLDRVEESRVGWIVCEPETSKMCLNVASKIYWDVEVIVIGEAEGCIPIEKFFEDDGSELPDRKIGINDIALILCTSGTTGKSKGAVHTHFSLLHQIMPVRYLLPPGTSTLLASKGTHITGTVFPLSCIAGGLTALIIGKITKINLFEAVHNYKPGKIFGFSTFLLLLVNDPEAPEYDFSSLNIAYTGGAPVTPAVEEALLTLPNLKCLINTYGLTEGCPLTSEYDMEAATPSKYTGTPPFSIGKVCVGTAIQIRDIDTEEPLGPNQRGEIWVKSKSLFHSYFKNVEATEKAFTDGWFKTGDVAYYDENGFIFLVDRIKEIFKYYNNHIAPTELEEVIARHPDVSEVCVVGVVDPDGGDRIPRAFVKLRHTDDDEVPTTNPDEIRQFADEKLPDYKRLRGGLYIVNEFLMGKTGKVSRQMMAEIEVPE